MVSEDRLDALCRIVADIHDPEQCRAFFEDLCTRKEFENMADRVYAAQLLLEGQTYAQVMAQSGISSATLSRISRCVQYGKGYSQVLKKTEDK